MRRELQFYSGQRWANGKQNHSYEAYIVCFSKILTASFCSKPVPALALASLVLRLGARYMKMKATGDIHFKDWIV